MNKKELEKISEFFNTKKTHLITKIRRLKTCDEFYKYVLQKSQVANEVYMACLALGSDHKTEELAKVLKKRIHTEKKTLLMVDKSRNLENPEILNLFKTHNLLDHLKLIDVDTCKYFPRILNECLCVFHSKLFIFDDEILITGANLYYDYYTNRVDRYYIVKDANYARYLCKIVFDLDADISESLHGNKFFENVTAQILHFDHSEEKDILLKLFDKKYQEMHITTAYLNFPNSYLTILKDKKFNLYATSPECNTFNNFGILNQLLTKIYSYSNYYTLLLLKNCTLYEYSVPKHSFHKKGIWIFYEGSAINIIGSSNYNRRSTELDLELNFAVFTTNQQLIEDWKEEIETIKKSCKVKSKELMKKRIVFHVLLIFYLFNILF
ncbi:hypothetical protein NUSPORA_01812 [Nucleospora cyclopteri]